MVQIKKIEVEVCKESHEVMEAAAKLIEGIRAKKTVAEIVAESLPALMTAVDGFDALPEEVKSEQFYETAGLGGARITKALIGPKDA